MCLLTFLPPDVQPTEKHLRKGAENNPDGHGFAIVHNDRLIIRKSMEPDTFIDTFMRLRSKHSDGPAMFHSRITTAGITDKKNCHPFPVGRDSRTVVGHNGILPAEAQPAKGDLRSDTRIFAEQFLPMRNLDGERSMRKLSRWLRGDKIVILTTNPRWQYRAYVVNQKLGAWSNGCWYSNSSYNEQYYSARWGGWGTCRVESRYETMLPVRCLTPECKNTTYLRHCRDCRGRISSDEWPESGPCDICGRLTNVRVCFQCVMDMSPLDWEEWVRANRVKPSFSQAAQSITSLATRSHDECNVCNAYGSVSTVTNVCNICLTCQDCGEESPGSCLCYVPSQLDREDEPPAHASFTGKDGWQDGWPPPYGTGAPLALESGSADYGRTVG